MGFENNYNSGTQMNGLHKAMDPNPVQVIAITGGKGGVGKTSLSVNLAVALASHGKKVMILDADLGLANIDIMLGINPKYNLSHVINGERDLGEIIITGPEGIKIVPAASGLSEMVTLTNNEHIGLIRAFSELSEDVDTLIVDTAAGISDGVVSFAQAAQEILVVVCDEPTSITDAYALIKLLRKNHDINKFRILANMVRNQNEGTNLFKKLKLVSDKYLDVTLEYIGAIPFDENVRRAIKAQKAYYSIYPASKASMAVQKLSKKVINWPIQASASGNIEFFIERLIQTQATLQGGIA